MSTSKPALATGEQAPAVPEPAAAPPAPSSKILRFNRSERQLHWALAVPFLICLTTAAIMLIIYNPDPHRPYRAVFSWTHRLSGVCLAVLPMIVIYRSRHDARIYFYNIRQAWIWVLDDFKWLILLLVRGVNKKMKLPDQGKFNAAEKINFMVLMATYPFYIITGALMWITNVAFLSWVFHVLMALMAIPLVLGHMYMALISSSGRPGLSGMFTGHVPRWWAEHHYGHWYREHHGASEAPAAEEKAP